jgi:long-chain acyl-CoA synthetase
MVALSQATNLGGSQGTLERPWLANWPKGVPKHVDYPDSTISQLLDREAEDRPGGVQFIFYGRKVTFGETSPQSKKVASALAKTGVLQGGRGGLRRDPEGRRSVRDG